MLTFFRPSLVSRIVVRLRIALAIIFVVLVSVAMTSYSQIRTLNEAVDELTSTSIATFVLTEESERSLTNLLLLLQRADNVARADALSGIEDQVTEQLTDLRDQLRRLQNIGSTIDAARPYSSALEEIETNAQRVFELRQSILMHAQALEESRQVLERIRAETQRLLEDMSYEVAQAINLLSGPGQVTSAQQFDDLTQAYIQNLVIANTISSILLEIEAIIDTAASLRYVLDEDEIAVAENALRFRTRNAVVLLSQLPESRGRAQLAGLMVEIRQTLFDDGVVQFVEDTQRENALLAAVRLNQLQIVSEISSISQGLVNSSRSEIEAARVALSIVSDRLVLIWTLATALSTSIILAALVFIVERQINRRVDKLTTAVSEISAGDTSYQVDVEGEDEFGEIARALEVFKANAEELNRSNEELEQFAYVAAHDLRSPLRAIQDLADWTLEDSDSELSDDARENMGLLQNRIARLNQLLSDLLEYSQVGSEGSDIADLSLSEVVSEIADMLDPDGRYNLALTCSEDNVSTCATPLRQVLLNLVSNAIKHHDKPTGHISIDVRNVDTRLMCSVTDDGAGIPIKYHERIFDLFKTLRPRDEVEGSGLGLAIVRKLLESHGGKISVSSDPDAGRGTKFTFDLPCLSQHQTSTQRAA